MTDVYKCLSCGRQVDIELKKAKKIMCPYCGYRILKKNRPSVVKRVPAK